MLDFGGGRQTKSVKSMNSMKSVDRILVQNSRQRVRGFNGKLKKKKTPATTPPITSSVFHLNKFEFTVSKFEFVQIEKII